MTLPISTAELVERFHKGETVSYLADQYRCSRGTVLYRLNQAGARSRTRSKINARTMLTAHRPVLLGLLRQVERTLESVQAEFAEMGRDPVKRRKYLDRIARLQDQIHALEQLTAALPARVDTGKQVTPCCLPS